MKMYKICTPIIYINNEYRNDRNQKKYCLVEIENDKVVVLVQSS